MPFGLRNGGNTYQGLMDQILEALPFCFVYGDSILIFSKDLNPQVEHLQDVFLLCHEYGLTIGLPKCLFAFPNIKYLGHCLSATDCSPLVKHSATISAFPKSMNKPGLQRFLGMINFYRKFLLGAARVLALCTDALKSPGKVISWSSLMDSAFVTQKSFLHLRVYGVPLYSSKSIFTNFIISEK